VTIADVTILVTVSCAILRYTIVSTMKMNACSVMMSRWKIAQPSCNTPASERAASPRVHERDQDEDHFPRTCCQQSQCQRIGLATSSTRLSSRLAGNRYGPKGV